MPKFNHTFTLKVADDSSRIYECDDNIARIDFISQSGIRVAIYKKNAELMPTFCVNPTNDFLLDGRERLSTDGFDLCKIKTENQDNEDLFSLPCGVDITLNKRNFLLSYSYGEKTIFADRKPLAYNLQKEFGDGLYHYITRLDGEHIYGLGDKGGALDKSGRAFRIETVDCMGYSAKNSDPLYKHLPFYICENKTLCYGIFYDTTDTSYFDFGKEINNYYPAYKYFKTDDDCLVYYVFFGSKLSVLQQFCRLCGKQAFPPRWSFDYCASTMAYTDAPDSERQMYAFLDKLEKYDLSCQGFYLSSGYTSIGERRYVFNWNYDKFPNPKEFVERFSQHNINIIPNIKPAFLDSHPLYSELEKKGYFVKNPDGTPFVTEFWDGLGSYLDFTNKAAFDYWSKKVTSSLLNLGITSTWNDNNEFDIKDTEALCCGFSNGEVKASKIRSTLTYLMVASSYLAQKNQNPNYRPFLSTRSGNIAVRRLAQTWSGDNKTSFEDLRYCHNIGLTMSLSGFGFYGHDLGGFHGKMPSRQLLLRWLEHGIFEPRFTIHSWNEDGSATMPWSYEDIMPSVKALFEQRRKLIPYLYNCAYNSVENEIPINAPLILYYDDEELYAQNDCMLVGKSILVSFIFDEDKESTRVYLPKNDNWYLENRLYNGGQWVELEIPTDKPMPYFVKAGSVLPIQEDETVFTLYPIESGEFEDSFFTDDGLTYNYENGDCVKLKFNVTCNSEEVRVNYHNSGNIPFCPVIRLCKADKRRLIIESGN